MHCKNILPIILCDGPLKLYKFQEMVRKVKIRGTKLMDDYVTREHF